MAERLAAFIVGEGNWLPIAMTAAALAAAAAWLRPGRSGARTPTLFAMNLFVGVTLLVMGIGHVLAVTTKLMQGTLNGVPVLLYVIGAVVIIPAAMIIRHSRRELAATCNFWMAAALIVLGLINIPLAIPALLNAAYARHSRPRTGQLILVAWVLVNLGLFAGGMAFMLSGATTFEEFSM